MTTRRRRNNSNSDKDESFGYRSPNSRPGVNTGNNSYISSQNIVPIIDPEMSGRDRTTEFFSAIESMKSRQTNGVLPGKQRIKDNIRQRSVFTEHAKSIGKDLANTFAKLEKLTLLAKKKSLFDDKPIEIQELTYIIKQDINSLNKQISQLQDVARSNSRQNGKNIETHSKTVVVALQSKLATMSSDFKQVLEVRTENLKHQKSRREHFSQSPLSSSMPPSAFSGHNGSVLLQDEAQSSRSVAINMDNMEQQRYHQQMQLINEQDSYIQSRADTMQNIESTIVELGGIFQQLAHMVKEHEEVITRIDGNVDDTALNVEAAHSEILKYFQSVTNNRWLMVKVFAVLIIFFIIFVVFLA